jgi:hypothetical protein
VHQARLVIFDEDLDVVYLWNGSATINVVGLDGLEYGMASSSDPMDPDQARRMIDRMRSGEEE